MNIYVVVEGEVGEKKVYKHWIPLVNTSLSHVNYISEIEENNFFIISGNGYPNYFNTIKNAVSDVANNEKLDRLVIAIDSEDDTYLEKYNEVDTFIQSLGIVIDYKIIVQNFCLETWALGNKSIYSRNVTDPTLRSYQLVFNVSVDDPEFLPPLLDKHLNRAQFAEKYLRSLCNEKFRNLTYNKKNPTVLLHNRYFERIKNRYVTDHHLPSFGNFLTAFI